MFHVGDLVIYSAHGICKIDDICEKTVSGVTRPYYVLHPMDNAHNLTLSIPVHSDKVAILELMDQREAQEILNSFKRPGIEWNDKPNIRMNAYAENMNKGDRKEIASIINTLMRKTTEAQRNEKKLYEQDRKFLNTTQKILFKELAIALDTSVDRIYEKVTELLMENDKVKSINRSPY